MSTDNRKKDIDWTIRTDVNGYVSHEDAKLAVLMDIRDELKKINRVLGCSNCLEIPQILRRISRNTAKPRKPKA